MKKLSPVFFLFLYFYSYSQPLTVAQIYNFSVGDVTYKYMQGQSGAVYLLDTVTSKSFSAASDTIYYSFNRTSYQPMMMTQTWSISSTTFTQAITNLNAVPTTTDTFVDTLRTDTSYFHLCGNKVYSFLYKAKQLNPPFVSPAYFRHYDMYIEGLGYYFKQHHTSPDFVFSLDLLYYKKGAVTCGTLNLPVGVNEYSSPSVAVRCYPNPANDLIYVETSDDGIEWYASIRDIAGRELIREKTTDWQIDISVLQPGTYFLTMSSEKGSCIKKILKE